MPASKENEERDDKKVRQNFDDSKIHESKF